MTLKPGNDCNSGGAEVITIILKLVVVACYFVGRVYKLAISAAASLKLISLLGLDYSYLYHHHTTAMRY